MSKTGNSYIKRWLTGLNSGAFISRNYFILFRKQFSPLLIILFILGGVWEYNQMVFGNGFIKEKIEGHDFCDNNSFVCLIWK